MIEFVLMYGCEIWSMKEEDKRRITADEMDSLRRSTRTSRLERVRNEEIRNIMSATETVINRIERRSLVWFGHLLRMEDSRWPKQMFIWKKSRKKPTKTPAQIMERRNKESDEKQGLRRKYGE